MSAIIIEDVRYAYGSHAVLDGLTLEIEEGEFFALLGPNGAGKTTLFNLLMTLRLPQSGKVEIMGHSTAEQTAKVRQSLGVVFQDPALDDRLTAAENLEIHTVLYGLPKAARSAAIASALSWASLADVGKRAVGGFSGGMKRRLELARALMHGPKILLLDEPTLGLDPQGRRDLWERLADLRAQGLTVVMSTHVLGEAESCDRVGIMEHGRLVAVGKPSELVAQHAPGGSLEDVFIALTGRQLFDQNASARERMISFAKRGGELTK